MGLIFGIILIIVLLIIWVSALEEEVKHYYDSEWIEKQMGCNFNKNKED